MAEGLNSENQELKIEKCLTWYTRKPELNTHQRRARPAQDNLFVQESPTFHCSGHECFFKQLYELDARCQGRYTLSLMEKARDEDCSVFDVTCYLDDRNQPLKFCSRRTVRKFPHRLMQFSESEVAQRGFSDFNYDDTLKFVFLLHGNVTRISEDCGGEDDEGLLGLSSDLEKLWIEGPKHNRELKSSDNRIVKAHNIILKVRSEYELNAHTLPQTEYETLKDLVGYMYTGVLKSKLDADNVWSLYEASSDYGVPRLRTKCADFLVSTMSVDNALEILKRANANKDGYLKNKVIAFILRRKMYLEEEKWSSFCEDNNLLALEVMNINARQENLSKQREQIHM